MAWLGTTRDANPWLATARFDPGLTPRLEDESGSARQLKENEIQSRDEEIRDTFGLIHAYKASIGVPARGGCAIDSLHDKDQIDMRTGGGHALIDSC